MPRPNPAWTVQAFTDKWEKISSKVLPRYMPIIQEGSRTRKRAVEYGCGHYGCVMPTRAPGVVIKMTRDPTEIRFITAAMGIYHKEEKKKYWPEGITQYLEACYLDAVSFRGRKVAVIWRKSAESVGYGFPVDYDGKEASRKLTQLLYIVRELREAVKGFSLEKMKECLKASAENRYYEPLGFIRSWVALERTNDKILLKTAIRDRTRRAKVLIRGYWNQIEVLSSSAYTMEIGKALDYYFTQGIILADVHLNNIGLITTGGYAERPFYGITDPGHAIFFTSEYDKYSLEAL